MRRLLMQLVLVCLVPGLIGVGLLLWQMYSDDQAQTGKDTVHTARAIALAVDGELAKVQAVANALATSGALDNANLLAADLTAFHARARALLHGEDIVANVVLSDAGGQQVLNTLRPVGEPLPRHGNQFQVRRVFASGRTSVSDVFTSATTGKAIVTVDVPILRKQQVIYSLSVVLELRSLGDLLRNQHLPPDWISSVTDRAGTTAARSAQAERLVGLKANPQLLEHLQVASEGAFDTVTRDGIEALVAYARSPATGWTVTIAIPKATLLAPWRQRFALLVVGISALFALGCALAWRQGGRIAASVQQLAEAAVTMQLDAAPPARDLQFAEAEVAVRAIEDGARALAERERARVEAHDALSFSKARLDAAIGNMSDALLICDADGRFVEFNEAFATFHGFADRQTCRTTMTDSPQNIEAYSADGALAPFDQHVVPRALRGEHGSNIEYRLRRKDTGRHWFGSFSFAPIRSTDGAIVGAVVVARDITEHKQHAQDLAQAQTLLGLAQRAASAGLWDWDLTTGAVTWSDELFQLFRRRPLDTTASFDRWVEMIHPEDRARVLHTTTIAMRDHLPLSTQYRIMLPSGESLWIDTLGDTTYDAQGQAVRLSGICIDASLRKRAEDDRLNAQRLEAEHLQVLESSRLKSQFFANMSHELRTPLGAIVGFADLLGSGAVDTDVVTRQRFVTHIRTSALHLSRLIDEVLDLSKFDAGSLQFVAEQVDLAPLVKEVQETLYPSMQPKRISLSATIDPTLVGLQLDPGRLKQVLFNLLSNAIKFSPDGSHIEVRARPQGPAHFCIEVEDRGIGIAAADLPRLFVDFQQLDTGYAKRHQGTGLGLALTRRIVQAQGGTVGARSTLGRGSTFYAVLGRWTDGKSTETIDSHAVAPQGLEVAP